MSKTIKKERLTVAEQVAMVKAERARRVEENRKWNDFMELKEPPQTGFQWRLSLDDYPEVGSLIDTHLGVGVVIEVELLSHKNFNDWLPRAVADVGEMNVLSFYNEHKSDCLEDWGDHKGLAVKLTTNKSDYHYSGGEKWVLFSHPRYNRAGPLMDRTWWCGDYYPSFSHINPECLRLKA